LLFFAGKDVQDRRELSGAFLTFGCCFSLVFQASINMGLPVKYYAGHRQPLPMVSMVDFHFVYRYFYRHHA